MITATHCIRILSTGRTHVGTVSVCAFSSDEDEVQQQEVVPQNAQQLFGCTDEADDDKHVSVCKLKIQDTVTLHALLLASHPKCHDSKFLGGRSEDPPKIPAPSGQP